jgi:hypothetical protein
MLKKVRPTIIGGNNANIILKWAYDFKTATNSRVFTVSDLIPGFYGESEYNVAQYSEGELVNRKALNTTGYGTVVTVGIETDINGYGLSIQEMNVLALVGKTL